MASDAYIMGYMDYTELQCMVSRTHAGVYVWNMSIDGMTLEEATVWARDYIDGWRKSRDEAEALVVKRISSRPCAA